MPRTTLYLLAALLLLALPAAAHWPTTVRDNLPIAVTPDVYEAHPVALPLDNGRTLIMLSSQTFDNCFQILNRYGEPEFPNLQPLCPAFYDPYAYAPHVIPDGSGGAYAAWESQQGLYTGTYAQRINSQGDLMWSDSCIKVFDFSTYEFGIGSDGLGGLLIAAGGMECYVQRLDPSGQALWGSQGALVCNSPDAEVDPTVVNEGAGLPQQEGYYSQAITLERGWNLVSWYLQPYDPTDPPLFMDDLFKSPDPPPPEGWWFEYDQQEPVDMVGKYDESPFVWQFFPAVGARDDPQNSWIWDLQQSFAIYLESPAHFWECAVRPVYTPATNDLTPSNAWDEFQELGLNDPTRVTHWYFISYSLRKQLKIQESNTVTWLFNNPNNPLSIIKDDAGNWYKSGALHPTLKYLIPGKGYFLGFQSAATVVNCPWFSNEGNVPAAPPESDPEGRTLSSAGHFQFKPKTHWWYPIEIDTVAVEGLTPAVGDEIAVFDGDLCVGAQTFDGEYPIYLAAWKDDIATLNAVDGYLINHEMTFKWFDASANQEITFTPPPATQAVEANPYYPAQAGFGMGFCANRSLVNGIQSVTQLPQEFKLLENYPNPFNSETIIPLELPQRSKVTLEIFNVRGERIGQPYQNVYNAGWPKLRWNAAKLPSGVYFYRITAEGLEHGGKSTAARKLLILK